MARQRTAHIQESLEFLLNLEAHYRGEPQEPRIKVLRFLKEDPSRTLEGAARLALCSERSANRWWAQYQARGLEAVLAGRRNTSARALAIGRDELEELRTKLQNGELETLNDVQAWLRTRFNIDYSLKGVANLLQRKLKARRVWIVADEHGNTHPPTPANRPKPSAPAQPPKADEATIIPDKLLHFLNRLPLTGDMQSAVDVYRQALSEMIGEVERVSLFVNVNCDLQDPDVYQPGTMITVDTTSGSEGVSVTTYSKGDRPSDQYLENFKNQGLPLHEYHEPIIFDYYFNDKAYIGTIFLWRLRIKPAISERARKLVALLEPFIIYILSDLVARYHYAHPVDRMFHDALKTMATEASLSPQERRVVSLRLLGLAYKEIADQLNISEDAIKKHLGSVHRKTGTRSYTELFAKYFTPRLNLHNT